MTNKERIYRKVGSFFIFYTYNRLELYKLTIPIAISGRGWYNLLEVVKNDKTL